MKKQMVLVIDVDKLTKEEWAKLWRECIIYAARIHEDDYNKITDFVDQTKINRHNKQHERK